MKKIPETKIGDLQIERAKPTIAYLHCFCTEASNLNVDILNEQGKSYRTHKAALSRGPQKATVKLGQLPPGHYNAWITLGQLSAIRSFTINPSTSFKDRIKKWVGR